MRVDEQSMSKINKALSSPKELGGVFEPVFSTTHMGKGALVVKGLVRWGEKKDAVNIPHGIHEFHTHPNACTPTECYSDMPSATDMRIITADFTQGNVSHTVFSQLFTYVCSPGPSLKRDILNTPNGRQRQAKVDDIVRRFEAFEAMMRAEGVTAKNMRSYSDRWMRLARRLGFSIQRLRRGERPVIRFRVHGGKTR